MGVEKQTAAYELRGWVTAVRQSTVAEFEARHDSLFFFIYEGDRIHGPFSFQTEDFETTIRKICAEQWEQLNIRIVPIVKSPRSPYQDRISIGRTPSCDVMIRHRSVSKLHAHIWRGEEGYTLMDVGSHNGTRIRGARLDRDMPVPLRPNDSVVFGVVPARALDARGVHALLSRLIVLAEL